MFSCYYFMRILCVCASFQLLLPGLEGDLLPDQDVAPALQSAPVHISFVELTAKKGTSFCNSYLVPLNEGRRVKEPVCL